LPYAIRLLRIPPCPDPFETRLRGFIAELSACTTTDERDQVLGNIADEVRVILNSHPV
jgi:hypothetical protein